MRYKKGVDITHLRPELSVFFPQIEAVFRAFGGADYRATITSGADGTHTEGSLHYKNRALDLRIRDLPPNAAGHITKALRALLGRDYDVVLEKTHIHLEWDPR